MTPCSWRVLKSASVTGAVVSGSGAGAAFALHRARLARDRGRCPLQRRVRLAPGVLLIEASCRRDVPLAGRLPHAPRCLRCLRLPSSSSKEHPRIELQPAGAVGPCMQVARRRGAGAAFDGMRAVGVAQPVRRARRLGQCRICETRPQRAARPARIRTCARCNVKARATAASRSAKARHRIHLEHRITPANLPRDRCCVPRGATRSSSTANSGPVAMRRPHGGVRRFEAGSNTDLGDHQRRRGI